MKIFIVQNVARQVEGDLMLVQVEKGFMNKNEAVKYVANLPRQKTEILKTDAGEIECFCARGIYEVDIDTEFNIEPDPEPDKKTLQFTPDEVAKIMSILGGK